MATYILYGNYTQQGMDKIRGAPARIDTATEMSARLYLNNWSPAKLTLHSGTSISA